MGATATVRRMARRFGWARVIGLCLLVLFLLFRVWDPAGLQLLMLKTFDLYQVAKPREAKQRPVVIVDIDEASLNELGQWPWPRTLISDLVGRIVSGGGVVTGFDVVFPEPDRTSPNLLADSLPGLGEDVRAAMRQAPAHDQLLADQLAKARVVLGQSAFNPRGEARDVSAPKSSFATLGADPKPYLLNYPQRLPNLKVLEDAAAGRGMFTILPEPDGIIRRVPVALVAGGELVPSLSLDMLRVATGQTTFLLKTDEAGVKSIVVAGVEVPTDARGRVWVYFAPHDPARYVSARDVLAGKLPPDRLAGKLVLVGTSASGLLDIKATPVEAAMPGVEIHAQLLENVLTGKGLSRPSWAIGAEIVLALTVGLAIVVLAPLLGATWIFLLGTVVTAGVAALSWYSFAEKGMLLDVTYPLGSSFAIFAAMTAFNYFREEAQKNQIRGAFGQYLSPALVEQLAENPERLKLGGETKEMTILFSDVRGFTSISEAYKNDPQGLTVLINRLLTPISHAIMSNAGTIDKYMGDNVMAFWNAPLDDADHACNACEAALQMTRALDVVNEERMREAAAAGRAVEPLSMGMGINTGECVVGNMGSDVRFDYTVLGDAVNLASRLEGQTRAYGVRTILGARTAELVRGRFVLAELDSVRVLGKRQAEVIYTLLGRVDADDAADYATTAAAVAAILDPYRRQDWIRTAS
ncbi:MAG: CHASE2 domain-containing protein, partial [Hyphomicrobiales bacterium]